MLSYIYSRITLGPFGAVFVWRNEDDGKRRFRGVFSGLYNDLRYNIVPTSLQGAEAVFTFENFNVPFGRPEYVEGQRIEDVDLESGRMRMKSTIILPPAFMRQQQALCRSCTANGIG